jgi:hypothetical protein
MGVLRVKSGGAWADIPVVGSTGPQGPAGAQGAQGAQGVQGPQGVPGSPGIITVAASAPASPELGRLWWNSTSKVLSVWSGTVWEPVVGTWA